MSTLDSKAVQVLSRNDRGGYTVPTARLYPYQWNWDSAFVALGFATFDRTRAWKELQCLLEGQWDDGMVPSIIFRHNDPDYFPGPATWQTQTAKQPAPLLPSTGISQPPILACIMRQLVASGDDFDLSQVEPMIEPVLRWHEWYQRERSANGVVATVHPWETGRDNCPDWESGLHSMQVSESLTPYERKDTQHADPSQRPSKEQYDRYITLLEFGRRCRWNQKQFTDQSPFLMADPGIHFILLRANKDLLHLAEHVGNHSAIERLQQLIAAGEKATDTFWNDSLGAFTAKNMRTGEFSNGLSSASTLCFFADAGTAQQRARTIEQLERIENQVQFLMPSWDPDSNYFDPQRYWCGPVWPQMNYLISRGLDECGYKDLAGKVRKDLNRLIQQSGFWECFNPLTGDGCLGNDFSWTAAIWLAWVSPGSEELAA